MNLTEFCQLQEKSNMKWSTFFYFLINYSQGRRLLPQVDTTFVSSFVINKLSSPLF